MDRYSRSRDGERLGSRAFGKVEGTLASRRKIEAYDHRPNFSMKNVVKCSPHLVATGEGRCPHRLYATTDRDKLVHRHFVFVLYSIRPAAQPRPLSELSLSEIRPRIWKLASSNCDIVQNIEMTHYVTHPGKPGGHR